MIKEVVWSKTKFYIRDTVGWMSGLVGGLQNHTPRFESGTDLAFAILSGVITNRCMGFLVHLLFYQSESFQQHE